MKNQRVLKAFESGPKTVDEIAKETGISPMEVRRYLLRFAEQGKVESFQREGKSSGKSGKRERRKRSSSTFD